MNPRGLIAFVSIVVGTFPLADASALGLGDAELQSRLNEPLAVEIAVVGAPPQSKRLNATIGTESVRAGELSGRLRAEAFIDQGGRAYIRVTTERAMREPIVSFLLVVESAREHVMREYTLLLDPPGYSLPVLAAPAPEAAVATPSPPAPVVTTLSSPEPKGTVRAKRIGPVARGTTLSGLAMANGTPPGVTWAQMTWALFRLNPHAFIDGDINKLRSGAYLEVPSRATVSRWSHRQALDLITAGPATQQVAEAPATSEPLENPDPPQPVPSPAAPESEPESPQPLFRVLSPNDIPAAQTAGTIGSPATPRERERLRQLVEEANRQIQGSHMEIAKARKQLADTTLQISTLVETVEKKDSEIRSLENRLTELREFVRQRSAEAANPDPNWLQRIVLEALILVTLVGVLAVTLSRWNDARRGVRGNVESGPIALQFQSPTVNPERPPLAQVEDDGAAELATEELVAELEDAEQPPVESVQHEEIELHDDHLMEANAYLAYGYHEKAKEVLEVFIKENPANAEGRLVMLRALHAIKEKRKFRRHAEALLELIDGEDDERWIEAIRLGRAVLPDERLFDADTHKRAEDENWEKTIWTGARPTPADGGDENTYLDFDEFKYVDLFLLDDAGTSPDVQDPTAPEASADDRDDSAEADAESQAELAKWRAEMSGTEEDHEIRLDLENLAEEPLDDPMDTLDDEVLDDPVEIVVGEPLDGPIDFSLEDPTDSFLDVPTDIPTDVPSDDER